MRKIVFALIAVCVLLSGCQGKKEEIKIGVILPLTGNGAIYGEDIKKGIDLAYSESNIKDKIQLLYQDDAADTKTAINALTALKNQGVSICVGGVMSNVAKGLLPIINSHDILLLSPKATDISLSQVNDMFFRIWPTDDLDGRISAKYINLNPDFSKIAILYSNTDYGVGIRKIFKEELSPTKEIVFDESFSSDIMDFKPVISKLKSQNPDVVFFPAYYREVVMALKCMNELNCDFHIAGVSSFYDKDIKDASGQLLDKIFFTYPEFDIDADTPEMNRFVQKYQECYNMDPNAFSAYGYDSYLVLETLIYKHMESGASETSGKDLYEILQGQNIVIKGVTGNIEFDEEGDAIRKLQLINLNAI